MNATPRLLWLGLLTASVATVALIGCGGRRDLSDMSSRQLLNYGLENYQNEKYLKAVNAFQTIVFNYPGNDFIDTAQYYLAQSYYGEKEYTLASVEYNRLLVNYPASPFAPTAQLMKAVCFYEGTPKNYGLDQTDLETAIRQFEDYIIDYPESDAMGQAREYLTRAKSRLALKDYKSGVVYVRVGDLRAARTYFQRVVDEYTETEYAALASYQLAECDYKEKKYAEALERFENFRVVFPDHEWVPKAAERACDAAFKGGRKAFEEGRMADARALFGKVTGVCGTDNDKAGKAQDYLNRIVDSVVVDTSEAHAGS